MSLITIQITRFPLVIFTDAHCHLNKIREVRRRHPHSKIISLGDSTDLFSTWENFNRHMLNYLIEQQIPMLEGNHESYIRASRTYESEPLSHVLIGGNPPHFNLDDHHVEFLTNLPRGFRLDMPDGTHYLCYHNTPNELWGHYEQGDWTEAQFNRIYNPADQTVGIIHGHLHKMFVEEFKHTRAKRYSVGALKFKNYCLLTEQGIVYKSLDD